MRPIVYHVAISLDGFIAGPQGQLDAFSYEGDHVADYLAELERCGVALMGRRTYEVGLAHGVTDPYPWLETYVASRSLESSPDPRVTILDDEALLPRVQALKAQEGRPIYVCGGADLASQLAAASLIDEVIVKTNPVALGEGISLFAALKRRLRLALVDTRAYESGVVRARYRVLRE